MIRIVRPMLLLLLFSFTLVSCAAVDLAMREPPKIYALTPKTTFDISLPSLELKLLVEPPSAKAGLNNSRIALHPNATSLNHYANALWVDVVPIMVQTLMIESLDASEKLDALGIDSLGERPDYVMRIHIREFQAEYDDGIENPPIVNVRLQARLLTLPERDAIATHSAQQLTRSQGTSVDEVVLAFDEALGKVLKRVVHWAVETLAEKHTPIET